MKIIDEKISPYTIELNNGNYDVLEDTLKKDKKGKLIFKTHGHFSNVENALNKITKLLVEKDTVFTIKEYVKEIKETRINIIK